MNLGTFSFNILSKVYYLGKSFTIYLIHPTKPSNYVIFFIKKKSKQLKKCQNLQMLTEKNCNSIHKADLNNFTLIKCCFIVSIETFLFMLINKIDKFHRQNIKKLFNHTIKLLNTTSSTAANNNPKKAQYQDAIK